jgi:ATP-dependent RNA helicase DOB1
MEMNNLKDMVLGKPAPLVSTFRLSYYSILNLMSRAEGQFTAEHVIRNSFHQFQYEKVCTQPFPLKPDLYFVHCDI